MESSSSRKRQSDASGSATSRKRPRKVIVPTTRLKYTQFSAWIKVGGKEVEIWEQKKIRMQKGGEVVVQGYIASEAGQEFGVLWTDTKRAYTTCSEVHIDGVYIGEDWFNKSNKSAGLSDESDESELDEPEEARCVEFMRTSDDYVQPLTFSPMKTTDDDAYLDLPPPPGQGEIRIDVMKCKLQWTWETSRKERKQARKSKYKIPQLGQPIHETSAKASALQFQLGSKILKPVREEEDEPSSEESDSDSNYKDNQPRRVREWFADPPRVIFKFLYRSEDRLRADGIIPPGWTRPQEEVQELALATTSAERTSSEAVPNSSERDHPPESQALQDQATQPSGESAALLQNPHQPISRPSPNSELEYIDHPPSNPEDTSVVKEEAESMQESPIELNAELRATSRNTESTGTRDPESLAVTQQSIDQSRIDEASLHERYRQLQANLEAVTQELGRVRGMVKQEIKNEDEPVLMVNLKEETTKDGKIIYDLTEIDD